VRAQHSAQLTLIVSALDVHYSGSQLDAMLDRDPSPSPPVAVIVPCVARNIFSKRSLSNGCKDKTGACFEAYGHSARPLIVADQNHASSGSFASVSRAAQVPRRLERPCENPESPGQIYCAREVDSLRATLSVNASMPK